MNTDTIILNLKLKEYPELHDFILEHEKLHYEAKDNVWNHLYIDLTDNWKGFFSKRIGYALWVQDNILMPSFKNIFIKYMNLFLFFFYKVADVIRFPFVVVYILFEKRR